jgi:division protein CdvB (Snf7/Vps24/ESCRT-III family)
MSESIPKDIRGQLKWARERVDAQLQRLSKISSEVDRRERAMFERVISLEKSGQGLRAERYSVELSELKKLRDTVRAASATLDAVSLKLDGSVSLGDAIAAISGARTVVSNLSRQIKGINPDLDRAMSGIDDVLSSTQQTFSEIYIPSNEESERIIEEATAVVDLRRRQSEPLPEPQPQ